MATPVIFSIKESYQEITKLMKNQNFMIIQRLRVLQECKKNEKTGISKRALAESVGVNHNSANKWRKMYIDGGIKALLSHNKIGFKPSIFNEKQKAVIEKKLNDSKEHVRGFTELQALIEKEFDCKIKYVTLWSYVKRNFGAKIKVARKSHILKDEKAVDLFKKNFGKICRKIIKRKKHYQKVNLYCQDESRFGLFTRNGSALTAKGIKPICPFQQVFQSTYVFGAFSPINGSQFILELPYCNSQTFQIFIDKFSKQNSKELKIMLLDNASFHKAKKLIIPDNIVLVFMPPYSPELNPAEKIWWTWKRNFENMLCENLNELSNFISTQVFKTTKELVINLARYEYIFSDYWTI
jgi:transposase